ncbi:MAG: radical SAM protein, partial [Clostridia bacterium]|nr:radical SAM protein [Clostridia bacterium]
VMIVGECKGCGACTKGCNHPECEGLDRCAFACPYGVLRIAGERVEAKALAEKLKRQSIFLEEGGITLSGGEPLSQPAFALELLRELKPLHTVIETCGYADADAFLEAAKLCDIVYMDIKIADPTRHKELTGVDNAPILRNFDILRQSGKPYLVRVPLIPDITDTPENLAKIATVVGDSAVELLPYNRMAGAKYPSVGKTFTKLIPKETNNEIDLSVFQNATLRHDAH